MTTKFFYTQTKKPKKTPQLSHTQKSIPQKKTINQKYHWQLCADIIIFGIFSSIVFHWHILHVYKVFKFKLNLQFYINFTLFYHPNTHFLSFSLSHIHKHHFNYWLFSFSRAQFGMHHARCLKVTVVVRSLSHGIDESIMSIKITFLWK